MYAGSGCNADDLSMNSKCYRKFDRRVSWFNASNDCLSRGGSLAVFTGIGRPSDSSQLADWLNIAGTDMTNWIGLTRSWWKTANEGGYSCAFVFLYIHRLLYCYLLARVIKLHLPINCQPN